MAQEQQEKNGNQAKELARKLAIPVLGAEILSRLELTDPDQARDFLYPSLANLPNPWLFKDMDKGVDLILDAREAKTPVLIVGDYDVDGICATVLLVNFLCLLGMEVDWFIPDRIRHGYGLSEQAMSILKEKIQNPMLLITVDNGMGAVDAMCTLNQLGCATLITDHHRPGSTLPKADAIINPQQSDCLFPFSGLSGTGVVFFLVMALRSALVKNNVFNIKNAPNLKQYLDLVALGTIADSMPLVKVNRILVRAGMEMLSRPHPGELVQHNTQAGGAWSSPSQHPVQEQENNQRPGIRALMVMAGIGTQGRRITSEDIAFGLAPRINAAGRMGRAGAGVQLLMAQDWQSGWEAAQELEQLNTRRKTIQQTIIEQANQALMDVDKKSASVLVLYNKKWHLGVVGIVAARICEQYNLPTVVLTEDPCNKKMAKGSGRAPSSCDLFDEIKKHKDLLAGFGGHSQAIGLNLDKKNLPELVKQLNLKPAPHGTEKSSSKNSDNKIKQNIIEIEKIDHVIDKKFMFFMDCMEPFGQGNIEPIFLCSNIRVRDPVILKEKHLRFTVQSDIAPKNSCQAIAFNQATAHAICQKPVDIFFRVRKNTYRGQKRVQLVVESICASR